MNIFNGYLAHSEREEVLRFAVFGEHPFVIHARMSPLLWLCSPSGCVSVHHNCYRLTDSVSLILGRIWILIVGLETNVLLFFLADFMYGSRIVYYISTYIAVHIFDRKNREDPPAQLFVIYTSHVPPIYITACGTRE